MTPSPSRMQERKRRGTARIKAALLDGPPASRDHQRMDPTVRELVLLALLSAFLCGVALIYAEPIATAVFAALTSGCVVICCKALARLMDLKGSLASRSPSTDRRARRELTTTLEIGAHRGPLAAPQTAAGELRDALR